MKRTKSGTVRARVVWDEVNLGEIEANKPPRQKIDEPKTPYHVVEYEDDEGTALDYGSHAKAIQFASSSSERGRRGHGLTTYGDEAEDMEWDEEGCRGEPHRVLVEVTKRNSKKKLCRERPRYKVLHAVMQQSMARSQEKRQTMDGRSGQS
eukprot:Gb_04774 [translate_table: standard]